MFSTLTLVISVLIALGVGAAAAWKLAENSRKSEIYRIEHIQAKDHSRYLDVLRRELANHLLRHDSSRFLRSYRERHVELSNYKDRQKVALKAELLTLCEKYPYLEDFDIVAVRPHVLYDDALSWRAYDDVLDHYWAICRLKKLNSLLNQHWEYIDVTSDEDLAHCEEYVRKLEDARFAKRLDQAVDTYYRFREAPLEFFENDFVSITPIPQFEGLGWGIYFKDTKEYGIRTMYSFDDPDRKPLVSYFRSDYRFEKQVIVDTALGAYV